MTWISPVSAILFHEYDHELAGYRAATDLKVHVELAARELSLERFTKFENELYQVSESVLRSASR